MSNKAECSSHKNDVESDEDSNKNKGVDDVSSLLPLEKLTLGPKKKLLVLSLGGFLCDRINRKDRSRRFPRNRSPDAAYGSYQVYKRPYCKEFLDFCLERFEVGIWSTAREWYTESALGCIDRNFRSKFLFIWTQDKCTETGFSTLHKKSKPIFLKELKEVWKSPLLERRFSQSNTLMIEDEPYKALLNPPNTAIFLTEYKVDSVADSALAPNSELRRYLDDLVSAAEVPSYVKAHPFGQPAITSAHPDWYYYTDIIRRYGPIEVA